MLRPILGFVFAVAALIPSVAGPPSAVASGGSSPIDVPGDWPQSGHDAQLDGYNPDESVLTPKSVPNLHVVWTEQGRKDVPFAGALISGSTVFTTKVLSPQPLSASIVEALDLHTGRLIWSYAKSTTILAVGVGVAAVANGTVFLGEARTCGFQCRQYRLDALDAATGSFRWSVPLDSPNGGLLVSDGVIHLGEGLDQVALSATDGSELWRTSLGSGTIEMTVGGGLVFVASWDEQIRALDVTTGHVQWTVDCGCYVFAQMPYVAGVLYVPESNDSITARDGSTGQVIWSITTQSNGSPQMAVASGRIYFGDLVGRLVAVRASDGKRLWRTKLGGLYDDIPYPAVAGGVVYGGLTSGQGFGTLFAIRASNGAVLWSYPISTFVPTVSHGMLFAGSNPLQGETGALYAFGL